MKIIYFCPFLIGIIMVYLQNLKSFFKDQLNKEYNLDLEISDLLFNETRKEFEGDTTLVLFPLLKLTKRNPNELGQFLGEAAKKELNFVSNYNIVKGFLNISYDVSVWTKNFQSHINKESYHLDSTGKKYLVEFSSPNTNKPLHLGHIRNILLGWSCSQILKAAGHQVIKTQIINDRGIAICKSMLAWKNFGEEKTPESTETKSDHFVGDFYVLFERKFQEEYKAWQNSETAQEIFIQKKKENQEEVSFFKDFKNTYFNEYSDLGNQAKKMLILWEQNDTQTKELWRRMNQWVYDGFEKTYRELGVHFDSYYYESDTYLLGKDIIEQGLEKKVFYKKNDGSVWIDLEDVGLDHKLVLRSDGTSVYMTQDIGTARKRYEDTKADGMVYTVADEQNYHFQALFEILKKLQEPYSEALHHLSYGMVDLPSGRMKSREGTVVDADDLMKEVVDEARKNAEERGETIDLSPEEKKEIYQKIGKAALKFFILKVNPKKRMVFNPEESVDMQGTTGPYVQNAYVRIQSILRKAGDFSLGQAQNYTNLEPAEIDLIKLMDKYSDHIKQAADQFDPSIIANYCYELARAYHKFYNDVRILGAENDISKAFRIQLSILVARVLKDGFELIGIEMPNKM